MSTSSGHTVAHYEVLVESLEAQITEKDTQLSVYKDMLINALCKLNKKYEKHCGDSRVAEEFYVQEENIYMKEDRDSEEENMFLREIVNQQREKIAAMEKEKAQLNSVQEHNAHEVQRILTALAGDESSGDDEDSALKRMKMTHDERELIDKKLFKAVILGNLSRVHELLNRGAKVDARDPSNHTPLMFAAHDGHLSIVEDLYKRGALVDARNVDSQTPLMWAAGNNHLSIVQALLSMGADPNARDVQNNTALIFAVSFGHSSVIEALISAGATVNVRDDEGMTAVHYANYDKSAHILKKSGARARSSSVACRT